MRSLTHIAAIVFLTTVCCVPIASAARREIPKEHPRLLGSKSELRALAQTRPEEYKRLRAVAERNASDDYSNMLSLSLVCAIEDNEEYGRRAKQLAMKYITGPIRKGHETFGHDMARCALVYDLCYPCWTAEERAAFHNYMNQTVDANVQSETHVFHNAWYGYKNWGYGVAGYATYYENPRAPEILKSVEEDYLKRAAPALQLAGAGGGFAEGYYIHYWLYEWLFFCEVARRCEGADYYTAAPDFFKHRALASAFEMYPGLDDSRSRRPVPMGDGGGRLFGGDRDKALSARRILVNYYREDPLHQAIHTYNELTPRSSVGDYAYKDFLWHDATVPQQPLSTLPLSHYSPGPGYVYARSSWDDATNPTYFFFKCGDRFTAHQHLDVNHFLIYKHAELVGDGGHYDSFGTVHDVNYHLRSIAHNTLLVLDPAETWRGIRGVPANGNDGGQTHAWRHHNGAFSDVEDWKQQYDSANIADMLAYEDRGSYVYVAGDATRAYSPKKLKYFTRQIVYLRPDTFIIFDRVEAMNPSFKKTWLLQAMQAPTGKTPQLVITNGDGRLFVQTLLPEQANVQCISGSQLYEYGGQSYPPSRDTGPAPACRIEVSPRQPAASDYFLHVLTAAHKSVESVPVARVTADNAKVVVTVGDTTIDFDKVQVAGHIERGGKRVVLNQLK